MAKPLAACLLTGAAWLLPGQAAAQVSATDKAAAEALFDDGKELLTAGNYAQACPKFEASQRLDAGVGTLLYLADCYEKAGRTASAWATFREAASAAAAAGQADRENIARERAKLLKPRLSMLRLDTSAVANLPGLSITRGGEKIPIELTREAFPLDPGRYALTVAATDKVTWSSEVEIAAAPGEQAVVVPALEDAEKAVVPPVAATPPEATPTAPAPAQDQGLSGQEVAGLVIGGVGVAGLVVSGIFTGVALSNDSSADEFCDGAACFDEQGVTLSEDARSAATVSTIAFAAGATLLAGGVILFFTAPSSPSGADATSLRVVPSVGPGSAGLFAAGSF